MIEAVVTSVNYADFLAATLPTNRYQFDRMVVVTAPEDTATQRVCEFNNVQVILTDSFNSRWGEFCKGCGINDGLEELGMSDWVVQSSDADVVLPPLTKQPDRDRRSWTRRCSTDADRHILDEAWQRHQAMPRLQQEDDVLRSREPVSARDKDRDQQLRRLPTNRVLPVVERRRNRQQDVSRAAHRALDAQTC